MWKVVIHLTSAQPCSKTVFLKHIENKFNDFFVFFSAQEKDIQFCRDSLICISLLLTFTYLTTKAN